MAGGGDIDDIYVLARRELRDMRERLEKAQREIEELTVRADARAVYERRGEEPGDHIVKIDSLGMLVHSKALFEVEGWRMKAPPEAERT